MPEVCSLRFIHATPLGSLESRDVLSKIPSRVVSARAHNNMEPSNE